MRLEGSLVGPWVEEVLRVIKGLPSGALTVDLAALAYADRDGERLLRDLGARAEILGCSPFLAELLSPTPGGNRPEPWQTDDARLVLDLLAGDESAFMQLVRREHASMIRYAELWVSAGRAAEVLRDAWRRILAGLGQYDGHGSLRSWMFGIVAGCARSDSPRDLRAVPAEELAEEDAMEADLFFPPGSPNAGEWRRPPTAWPEDYERRPEMLERVRESMQRLPELWRELVFLRDVEGWSSGEVSALLGITEREQRLLLHRSRLRILADLERHLAA